MNKENYLLQKLKTDGYRLTKARKYILSILIKNRMPLSAYELKNHLEEIGITVNKTTIYRELDFLCNQKIIREIQLGDGRKRYEIWPDDHHHHLVCISCSRIECFEMEDCMEAEEKKILRDNNFKVLEHSLKFFGLCAECQ